MPGAGTVKRDWAANNDPFFFWFWKIIIIYVSAKNFDSPKDFVWFLAELQIEPA